MPIEQVICWPIFFLIPSLIFLQIYQIPLNKSFVWAKPQKSPLTENFQIRRIVGANFNKFFTTKKYLSKSARTKTICGHKTLTSQVSLRFWSRFFSLSMKSQSYKFPIDLSLGTFKDLRLWHLDLRFSIWVSTFRICLLAPN